MRNIMLIAVAFLCSLLSSASVYAGQKVTVAAAANVQPVMAEIKEALAKRDINVEIVSGSSGKLSAQIIEGAPYDVFVSADTKYPEELHKKGLAGKPKVYARGVLVLWTMNDKLKLDDRMLVLNERSVKKIAIPNPNVAPYGVAAVAAMRSAGIYDAVKDKLVYGESIAQSNHYIDSKTADIGFTSKSTVLAPGISNRGKWVEVDNAGYSPVYQAAVLLRHGEKTNSTAAHLFYDLLFSDEGRAILNKYGYHIP